MLNVLIYDMNILQHRLLNFTCTTTTNWKYYNETSLKDICTIILIIKGERFWGGLVQYQPLQKQRRNMNLKNGFVIAQYPNSQGVANR